MEGKSRNEWNRRNFLRNATLTGAGATLLGTLSASELAEVQSSRNAPTATSSRQQQAEQEATENLGRAIYFAMDDLDLDGFMSFFSEDMIQQDTIMGDFSDLHGGPPLPNCSLTPRESFRFFANIMMTQVGRPGRFMKFINASGSAQFGLAAELRAMPGSFFQNSLDLISYTSIRNGKIDRRNDYYDTAQLSPTDLAFVHPNGVPRRSCMPSPLPGDVASASHDMVSFVRALHRSLSFGDVGRVLQFFGDDAVLVHPLLHTGTGIYGPYNRGIQIRGVKSIARFLRAVIPLLPEAEDSSLVHIIGGSVGGAYEWKSGGIYSQQGLARDGIGGVTAVDLYNGRIQRMSVKFDTLQMTREQRDAVRRAVAREDLTV